MDDQQLVNIVWSMRSVLMEETNLTIRLDLFYDDDTSSSYFSTLNVLVTQPKRLIDRIFFIVLPVIVIFISIQMGILLDTKILLDLVKKPKPVLIGFIAQYGMMPFLAMGIAKVFRYSTLHSLALFVIGCCPGRRWPMLLIETVRSCSRKWCFESMDASIWWWCQSVGSDVIRLHCLVFLHDAIVLLHTGTHLYGRTLHSCSVSWTRAFVGTRSGSLHSRDWDQSFFASDTCAGRNYGETNDVVSADLFPCLRYHCQLVHDSDDWFTHRIDSTLTTVLRISARCSIGLDMSLEVDTCENNRNRSGDSKYGHCLHDHVLFLSSTVCCQSHHRAVSCGFPHH